MGSSNKIQRFFIKSVNDIKYVTKTIREHIGMKVFEKADKFSGDGDYVWLILGWKRFVGFLFIALVRTETMSICASSAPQCSLSIISWTKWNIAWMKVGDTLKWWSAHCEVGESSAGARENLSHVTFEFWLENRTMASMGKQHHGFDLSFDGKTKPWFRFEFRWENKTMV